MKTILIRAVPFVFAFLLCDRLSAQVPNLINHQGRVAVNGVNFDGNGQFKFALVDALGKTTYWSNDGTGVDGEEPSGGVRITVTKGLYSVLLGDTSQSNMTAVPASVFAHPDVRLRVWFSNLSLGFQLLTPDQRLAPNGYLPDGSVTAAKLAPGTTNLPVFVNGPNQAAAANTNYVVTSATPVSFTLPASANVGDTIQITGVGAGGWFMPGGVHETWQPVETARSWLAIASSVDGLKLVAVANNGRIYTSTDAGVSWSPRATTGPWQTVASSADGVRLIAGAGSGLYYSSDSGVTWTQSASGNWFSVASSSDGLKLIAATAAGLFTPVGAVFTSTDGGANWTPRLNGSGTIWTAVASSADGTKLAAALEGGAVTVSNDSGATWASAGPAATWRALTSSADGTRLAAAGPGSVIHVSSDSGQTWNARATSRQWRGLTSSTDGIRLAAVAENDRVYTSSDAGLTWTPRATNRAWTGIASSADGLRLAATVNGEQIYTSFAAVASGAANTEVTLAYTGPATGWQPVSPAGFYIQSGQIADGAVTLRTLAPDAFQWTPSGGNIYRGAGNVGIGTSTPNYGLSLGTGIADTKLALWDPGVSGAYGLGIQSAQFRFHVDQAAARFSFLDAPAGNELMTIKGTGNVGIGKPDPVTRLHVTSTTDTEVSIESTASGGRRWTVQSSTAATPSVAGSFQVIDRTGGVARMVILPNGNTGFSRAPVSNRLEIEGEASKASPGSWLSNSDRRIKTDIQPVTGALATLEKVRPVTYRYTEEYLRAHPDIKDVPYYNVIAQEFREVFPNAVKGSGEKLPDGSEILQVDTYPATITAIAAIKELKAENESLKKRLAALEEIVLKKQPVAVNTGGAK